DVTWQSAMIVTRTGRKIAIVGRYDVHNFQQIGGYDEVIGYDESIQPALVKAIDEIAPKQLAINYSESDSAADGLSHGMFLTLQRYFAGKPYQMISAEDILNALRGRKSPREIERITAAVRLTEEIIDNVTRMLTPGISERTIADYIHAEFARN